MTSNDFSVKYSKIEKKGKDLDFEISGNIEYGLHKTIINAIRRTLLTDIKTIAFNLEDIIINTNNSSLHNEFIKHRISLIPLYIDPEDYYKKYLFILKIKNIDNPIMKIYANNFDIYPLKSEIQKKINDPSEKEEIIENIKDIPVDYYDLNSPLNDYNMFLDTKT